MKGDLRPEPPPQLQERAVLRIARETLGHGRACGVDVPKSGVRFGEQPKQRRVRMLLVDCALRPDHRRGGVVHAQ